MRSFFHGWRRKAGVVTLAVACALCTMWMRSLSIQDVCVFQFGSTASDVLSQRGMIYWHVTRFEGELKYSFDRFYTAAFAADDELAGPERRIWDDNEEWYSLPYPLLVLPLTLLSAYLILWKPRKRKTADQPAISNLISN